MLKLKKQTTKHSNLIGVVYVQTTFNNTLITVTDVKGKTILFGSSGFLGLKGARRSTPYAGQSIANIIGTKLFNLGFRFLYIQLKNFGSARKSVIKGFILANLKVIIIKDSTPVAHNGCKAKKKRRI